MAGVPFDARGSGSPLLQECWGFLDCRVVNAMDGGDMTCFLGEVLEGDTITDGEPLWWRDARRLIPAEWNQEWDRKITEDIKHSETTMGNIDYKSWKSAELREQAGDMNIDSSGFEL